MWDSPRRRSALGRVRVRDGAERADEADDGAEQADQHADVGERREVVRALLEALSSPGKSFEEVVRETTARVSERTGGRQVPAAYGSAPALALLPTRGTR